MATDHVRSGHGMVLGKFMPPHAGHQYLIDFSRHFVERLTVLVCSIQREPIPGALRYAWMRELFPDVRLVHITDELPQEPADHPDFWPIWKEAIARAVTEPIDFVFASEPYGTRLAGELGAVFVPADPARDAVSVSGTAIRERPMEHWHFIPACVRPYFVRRVCLFGPESTGKSMLARLLAERFRTVHVPEFARPWLDPRQGRCTPEDMPVIARGQLAAEDALARQANRVLFCDTDLLLTTIWSDVLFGKCPQWIRQAAAERSYDLTFLLDIDVPWVDDSQRFLQHRREEFFFRCREALERADRPFHILSGPWDARIAQACRAVEDLLVA